jgi:hypothetical protein
MKIIVWLVLIMPVISCNMWGYRGTTFSPEIYDKTFFDMDKMMAHFPEDISGMYNISCNCNGKWIDFKDTSSKDVNFFLFAHNAFDSCKTEDLRIYFWRKNNTKKKYIFTIHPYNWSDTNRRVKGLIYAVPGSIKIEKKATG